MNKRNFIFLVFLSYQTRTLLSGGGSLTINVCDEHPGFVRRQRRLCRQHFRLMESVFRGYLMGLGECRYQFGKHRWNCTGHDVKIKGKKRDKSYMDRLITRGTRESAYVLAITSAGVSHQVTKACSSGVHEHCGCDRTVYDHPRAPNFKWSGCSDNIHFGAAFTQQFLDVREKRRMKKNPKLGLTNLHNNHVGRQSVMGKMDVQCKCHGVSGSCELQTCWRALPKFRAVGGFLQNRFSNAIPVEYVSHYLAPKYNPEGSLSDSDLIYILESPNFCNHDPRVGSLGTSGRQCNQTSKGPDSCRALCCDRGHRTETYVKKENCDCKFYWCCEVRCNTCRKRVEVSTCN